MHFKIDDRKPIKRAPAGRPAKHFSGDFKILRKCYNGLTHRHWVCDEMMANKQENTNLVMKQYDFWRPEKKGIRKTVDPIRKVREMTTDQKL